MIDDTFFANIIEPLVDKKFFLGDPQKGWDCLNSLREIYTKLGVDFPTQWKEYNASNYPKKWRQNEAQCRKDFAEFLFNLGEKLENPNFMRSGDLLLFKVAEFPIFPAVYVGSGKMIMVWSVGVKTVPFNPLKKYLKEARRLIK